MKKLTTTLMGLALALGANGCATERPVNSDLPSTASPDELRRAGAPETRPAETRAPAARPPIAPAGDDLLAAPSDVASPPADATRTASGLAYKVLRSGGGGQRPTAADTVVVHYTGWTTDGKRFDSSVARGEPARFPLSGVITGWTEGVQLMGVGDRFRFWIPAELAYGDPPRPGLPAGTLVFDVELLDIAPR